MIYSHNNTSLIENSLRYTVKGLHAVLHISLFLVFLVNVIVVLDQERLYNDFKKQFGEDIEVLHLPKSGGVRTSFGKF